MLFVATTSINIANFLFYSLAGRVITVSDYGALMSLVSLALIVTAPAAVAQNTLAKLVADVTAAGDLDVVRRLGRKATNSALLAGAGLIAVAVVLDGPLSRALQLSDPWLVPLAACAAAATVAVPVQRGILQGSNRFGELSLSMVVEALTRLVAVVPLGRIAGARGGLIAFALSMVIPFAVLRIRAARAPQPSSADTAIDLRRFVRATAQTGTGFFAITTMLYFDVVLVRHYFDAYNAGLYGATAVVGRAIFTGAAFVPIVLIPKIVLRRAKRISVQPIALFGITLTAIVAGCGIAIVWLAPERIVTLVNGPAYAGASPYVVPYVCAVSMLAGANVAAAVRVGLHRFEHVIPLVVIAAAEVLIVIARHATIGDVLWTIVGGHAAALIVLLAFAVLERQSSGQSARLSPRGSLSES